MTKLRHVLFLSTAFLAFKTTRQDVNEVITKRVSQMTSEIMNFLTHHLFF